MEGGQRGRKPSLGLSPQGDAALTTPSPPAQGLPDAPPLTGSGCRSEAVCPQRGPIPSPSAAQVPPPPTRMGLLNSISKKTLLSWELWLDQPPATNGRLCSTSAASHRPSHNLELLGLGLGRKRGKEAALSQLVSSITLVVRRV